MIGVAGFFFFKGKRTISIITENGALFSPKTDGRWDILLLGNRGDNAKGGGFLTDSIMVLSYRPKTGDLALISIPRDLWVKIPNYSPQRINAVYGIGKHKNRGDVSEGLGLAKEVVSNVTGLDIDFAVVADIEALRDIVNTLGGITVYEQKSFYSDFYGYKVNIKKGMNQLTGSQALAYVGIRDIDSDFGRMERQQKVLLAIKEKAFSLDFISNPKKVLGMLDALGKHLRTDLDSEQLEYLVKRLPKLEINSTNKITIDNTNYLYSSRSSAGAYILLPNEGNFDEIQEVCKYPFLDEESSMIKEDSAKKINN